MQSGLQEKLNQIKMLAMDADGVLTNGQILLGDGLEIGIFDVQDGFGITLAKQAGLITAVISSRRSTAVLQRAKQLGFDEIRQGTHNKIEEYETLRERYALSDAHIAYMGDDLVDILVMERVGLAIAVHNARPEVKQIADYVTSCHGGNGAVREAVELILKGQSRWNNIYAKYVGSI